MRRWGYFPIYSAQTLEYVAKYVEHDMLHSDRNESFALLRRDKSPDMVRVTDK